MRPTMREPKPEREQRGIQSIEVGGQLLHALAHEGRAMALKDLAAAAGMAAAKAHPYLVSLGKVGLVEQDRSNGRYGLGPLALQLGLMSLQQADPVRLATPVIEDLALATGHTVAMAVWGSHGPTIVRLAESPSAIHVNMRLGTVFSISGTASGQLFAAHLAESLVRPLYEAECRLLLAAAGGDPAGHHTDTDTGTHTGTGTAATTLPGWAQFASTALAQVRTQGLGRSEGAVVAGVSALAAPVFDQRGTAVLALTVIGPSAALDARWDGLLAQQMRSAAALVSARLGHRPSR